MRIKFVSQPAFLFSLMLSLFLQVSAKTTFNYHENVSFDSDRVVETPTDGGIKEVVPPEFQTRYKHWKEELLATEYGQKLWTKYENNKNFILTIEVSSKSRKGAGTGEYLWNENGLLVGAKIVLGGNLDRGFPDPIYYPVMNSISEFHNRREINGEILAATKFAHEFGHVNLTLESNQEKFKLQNKLMPIYNSIFLKNGFKTADQRLMDLANQMGGTPTQIWENREYWGETSAMNFILEKTNNKSFHCSLINKINQNVTSFAKGYEERFNKISANELKDSCRK